MFAHIYTKYYFMKYYKYLETIWFIIDLFMSLFGYVKILRWELT